MESPTTKKRYTPDAWETADCPFCASSNRSVYERYGSEKQFTYVKCNNCGLIYQSPRPAYNQHFIDAAYAEYYQFTESLNANDAQKVRHSGTAMFQKEIDYIQQFDPLKTAALDIGSGMGTFLDAARKYYPVVLGLDVSEKMAKFVEQTVGVEVLVEQFDDFVSPIKFSLIHMSHVLEHVPNPNQWLQKAKENLEPKGILVINIPNKLSLGSQVQHFFYKTGLKKQFSSTWNDPSRTPDHLFEPTIRSMLYLLKKNGYEVLEYYTYSRKDPASNSSVGSKLFNRSLKFGSNLTFITRPL